jgi:UDP-N-acetylglucosamine:LPS N-acetylglucosamine transferase
LRRIGGVFLKKILILYIEVGSCHTSIAKAIRKSIEKQYPGEFQINDYDFFKKLGEVKSDKNLKESWRYLLAHPLVAKWGYSLIHTDLLKPVVKKYLEVFMNKALKKGIEYIDEYKPDLIFSTYHHTTEIAARAKKRLGADFKVIGLNPDPFVTTLWSGEKDVDYWIMSSKKAMKEAMGYGVTEDQIVIYPYPIKNEFFNVSSKEGLMNKYNIDKNKMTILASSGGEGISNVIKYIKEMYSKEFPFNIIVVSGRNEKAKKELEELKESQKSETNLIPLGFVNNMNELISLCDFTVTRAGASSTFESLLMKKPIVFTEWTTYNDKPNIEFAVENNLGWYAPNKKKFFSVINDILNTNVVEEYVDNIKNLELHSGTDDIANFVVNKLKEPLSIK